MEKLILFDSAAPGKYQADLDMNAILKLCLEEAVAQYGVKIDLELEKIKISNSQEVYQMVLKALKSSGAVSLDAEVEELKELVDICTQNIRMLNLYKGGRIKSDIILLHPKNSSQKECLPNQHEEYFGWENFTDGKIQLIEGNGDHMTMMFEPYVKEGISALQKYLM